MFNRVPLFYIPIIISLLLVYKLLVINMIETITNTKIFDQLWDKYSKEDTFREMYVNFHNNLMLCYVEDVVFKEFRFKKKMKDEILSDIRYTVYDLSKGDLKDLNFPELSRRLLEITRTSCKEYQLPDSRIDSIMKKLTKSLHTDYENGWITILRMVVILEYHSMYEEDEI